MDDLAKRTQLEEALAQLSQTDLAKWAISNAERFIQDLVIHNPKKKLRLLQLQSQCF